MTAAPSAPAEQYGSPGPLPTSGVIDAQGRQVDVGVLADHVRDVLDDPDALLALYRDMTVLRRLDRQCLALARQGALALWAPIAGQEAVLAGVAHGIPRRDHLFISYREALLAHLRGVPAAQVLPMWRGSALGGWDPARYGITNPAIIVGTHGLHATGYAMAAALDGADEAAVALFGDGATSQGDLAEALNLAAVESAPVVFLCQNNQFAISVPVSRQSAVQPAQRAHGFGIPSLRVDGNDVLAVLAAARMAAEHAHGGSGPYFIEAVTYRMGPHTTNDDPTRYRTAAETEAWKARDPIDRLAAHLRGRGVLDDDADEAIRAGADEQAGLYRSACAGLPEPDAAAIFADVYAAPHPLIDEERGEYGRFLAALADDPARHDEEAQR